MCPTCGGSAIEDLFTKDSYTYVACRDCGSGRLDPIPTDTDRLYGGDYFEGGTVTGGYANYAADEQLHRRNASARLGIIHGTGGDPPGRILELGSGYGYFLDEAQRAGWTASGVDVSEHARRQAADLGVEVAPELASGDADEDVFAAFQVLEHMPDPYGALVTAVQRLAPGGLVVIETWDRSHWAARLFGRSWQQISPPAVIHLFTEGGLRTMAARLGLTDISVHPTPKLVSVGAVAGQLAMRYRGAEKVLHRAQASRLGTRAVRYGFGDLVTLTARKPR